MSTSDHEGFDINTAAPERRQELLPLQKRAWPCIAGAPRVGTMISATNGVCTPTPASYSYRWLADGEPIKGATAPIYTPDESSVGKALSVEVTAKRPGNRDTRVVSMPTAPVLAAIAMVTAPGAVLTAEVGQTLTADPGSWTQTPQKTTYTWSANGTTIPHATGPTLTLAPEHVGTVRVTTEVAAAGAVGASATSGPIEVRPRRTWWQRLLRR